MADTSTTTQTQTRTGTKTATIVATTLLAGAGLAAAAAIVMSGQMSPKLVIEPIVTTQQDVISTGTGPVTSQQLYSDGYARKNGKAVLGQYDVPVLTFRITAKNAAMEVDELPFQALSGTTGAFTALTDEAKQQFLDGCHLILPNRISGELTDDDDHDMNLESDGMLRFDGFSLAKDETMDVSLVCDLRAFDPEDAATLPEPGTFAFSLADAAVTGSEILTENGIETGTKPLTADQVRVGGLEAGGMNMTGDKASLTVKKMGTIRIEPLATPPTVEALQYNEVVSYNPPDLQTAKVTLGFKLTATDEPFIIDRLTFDLCVTSTTPTSPCPIPQVYGDGVISYDAASGQKYFSIGEMELDETGRAEWHHRSDRGYFGPNGQQYDGDSLIVRPGHPVTVRFHAYPPPPYANQPQPQGGIFQMNVSAKDPETFFAIGLYSGNYVTQDPAGAYILGDSAPVYYAPPKFYPDPGFTSIETEPDGHKDVFSFYTEKTGTATRYVSDLLFKVDATDTGATNWNSCKNLAVPEKWMVLTDTTYGETHSSQAVWTFLAKDGTPCATGKALGFARVTYVNIEIREARHQSDLIVDLAGATPGDTIQVSIPNRSDAVTWYADDEAALPINAERLKSLPATGPLLAIDE